MSVTIAKTRLTPPPRAPKNRSRRFLSLVISLGLVTVVLGYLGGPAFWQWHAATERANTTRSNVVAQVTNIVAPAPDQALVAQLRAATASAQASPIIVTYHNIGYNRGPETVTPEVFAAQMRLLREAGWATASAAQLESWLDGQPWPAHTVMVTFDDGARGVWQYADHILAQNNQHAVAYVITGFVGTHAPYYMTWPEITQLYASGRWDIEAHTHLGHVRVEGDGHGRKGPFLTTLKYLPDQRRVETLSEYQARVTNDLAESKRQIVSHGLPDPPFFAYPFSTHEATTASSDILTRAVQSFFKVSMLDEAGEVSTTTAANLAHGDVARMDITSDVTVADLARRLTGASAFDPSNVHPFELPNSWVDDNAAPTALPVVGAGVALDPGPGAYTQRMFAPAQTSLWRSYTVRATLSGFPRLGSSPTVGLIVLDEDAQKTEVNVSGASYEIIQGPGNGSRKISGVLPLQGSHDVAVTVRPNGIVVVIDGQHAADIPLYSEGPYGPAGGFGISVSRSDARCPVPRIENLTVL